VAVPPGEPLLPTSTGKPLTRKALARRIAKHVTDAAERCQSLATKTITPHVLPHTAAVRLPHAGIDTTVIALWLGHEQVETPQVYIHADVALKERALARTKPSADTTFVLIAQHRVTVHPGIRGSWSGGGSGRVCCPVEDHRCSGTAAATLMPPTRIAGLL